MRNGFKICLILMAGLFIIPAVRPVSAQEDKIVIYKVNTASLIVREGPGVKNKALFTLPKDSYVINYDGMMQSQEIVTISNHKGRWLKVCGMYGYMIGYVFEGFLVKAEDVTFRDGVNNCDIQDKAVKCGSEIFSFTDKTPLNGALFKKPETMDGDMTYISDNNPGELKKIISSGGGDIVMIVKNNTILQFISTPPARGGE